MNDKLVSNWNDLVSEEDTVYFLGDLAYGKGSKSTDYWLRQLNGNVVFVKGNHDKSKKIKFDGTYILEHNEHFFFLCHEPFYIPGNWKHWAIYGHYHNNDMVNFPFLDRENKRINVSVELTNFKPVKLDDLIMKIDNPFPIFENS